MVKQKRVKPGMTAAEEGYIEGWNARLTRVPYSRKYADQARGWLVCDAAIRTEEIVRALKAGRTPPISHHGREMNSVPTGAP